ncbi:hypothetical protein KC19_11G057500 [Ceratodon purpureus]|uniref:Secreted protein n=1 Tax=Ceratodon purpureus TaxID=3225 RepID=A0A8T0GEE1_CERPU|nr:hypothetical protein KC19_11G057500 [Ceratodon purpureus]
MMMFTYRSVLSLCWGDSFLVAVRMLPLPARTTSSWIGPFGDILVALVQREARTIATSSSVVACVGRRSKQSSLSALRPQTLMSLELLAILAKT